MEKYKSVARRLRELLNKAREELQRKDAELHVLRASSSKADAASSESPSESAVIQAARRAVSHRLREGASSSLQVCSVVHTTDRDPSSPWVLLQVGEPPQSLWVPAHEFTDEAPHWTLPSAVQLPLTDASGKMKDVWPEEALDLRAKLQATEEEFRRYRVRAETLLRQAEEAAESAQNEVSQLRANSGGGEGGGWGERERTEEEAEEEAMESAVGDLLSDKGSDDDEGGNEIPTDEKEKWSHRNGIAQANASQGDEGEGSRSHSVPSQDPASSDAQVELSQVQSNFAEYRRRAMRLVSDKEEEIRRMTEELDSLRQHLVTWRQRATRAETAVQRLQRERGPSSSAEAGPIELPTTPARPAGSSVGTSSGSVARTPAPAAARTPQTAPPARGSRATETGSAAVGPNEARLQYLRKVVVEYLGSEGSSPSVRKQLEATLVAVVGLSPEQRADIERRREAGGTLIDSLWASASHWLGEDYR